MSSMLISSKRAEDQGHEPPKPGWTKVAGEAMQARKHQEKGSQHALVADEEVVALPSDGLNPQALSPEPEP